MTEVGARAESFNRPDSPWGSDWGHPAVEQRSGDEVPLERPAACGAVFASVENDLQVEFIPPLFGKEFFGVPFGLLHAFAAGQLPTGHQPVNVRVYRKSRYTEGLAHDHRRRFVSNPRHGLKSLK